MEAFQEHLVNQYVLHKQHLLKGSEAEDVLQVVNDIIALHATSAATPYISLFARMKNFHRRHLDEVFYQKRNLVRLEAMRGTLFITSTKLAPILYQATKVPEPKLFDLVQKWEITQVEYRNLASKLLKILETSGKTLQEIKRMLPKELVRSVERRVGKATYKGTNINVVLNALVRRGIVFSEKAWETTRTTELNHYMLFQKIYTNVNLASVKSEEARTMLVKHYVKVFGPLTLEDISWWTSFSGTQVKEALATIEKKLLHVRISNLKGEYMMFKTDYEQMTKFKPSKTRSLSLLPYEDPYTKGYKIRERIIDKEVEKSAYVGGSVQPTILLNGKIIGTWNQTIERGKGPIKLRFFQRPRKDVEKETIQKARAIGKLMANKEVDVQIERD